MGAIMLQTILDGIYREFLRATLVGVARHGAMRWPRSWQRFFCFSASASSRLTRLMLTARA